MKEIRYNYATIKKDETQSKSFIYEVKLNGKSYNFKSLKQAKEFIDKMN